MSSLLCCLPQKPLAEACDDGHGDAPQAQQQDLVDVDLTESPAFRNWKSVIDSAEGLVGSGYMTTNRLDVFKKYYFGNNVGLSMFEVVGTNSATGARVPGVVFMRGHSVAILIVTASDEVVFVRQPRVPVGKHTLEIPAGMMDKDTKFKNKMLQEALEETGCDLSNAGIENIGSVYTSPGGSDEMLTLYFARLADFAVPKGRTGVEDEDINVQLIALSDVTRENVVDSKFWAAYGLAKHKMLL